MRVRGPPTSSLPPLMAALGTTALVKDGGGLVGRTDLYLHVVGPWIFTLGTGRLCRVDILPGLSPPQHIVHLFPL